MRSKTHMEAFLTSAMQAVTLDTVDFTLLQEAFQATHTTDEARDLLTALIDAYAPAAAAAAVVNNNNSRGGGDWHNNTVYPRALMKAIGSFIRYAKVLSTCKDSGVSNQWKLTAEDYILLALFFNEIATASDTELFALFAEAVAPFFQQTVTFLCNDTSKEEGMPDTLEDASTVGSLRGELVTLRLLMEKRLVTTFSDHSARLNVVAMQVTVLDTLRALLLALLQRAGGGDCVARNSDVVTAIEQVVEGILLPLTTVVESLRSSTHRSVHDKSSTFMRPSHAAGVVSPLVLTSALRVMEEFLWCCGADAASHHGSTAESVNTIETTLSTAARFTASRVLAALQQYLHLQQQQSMGSAAGVHEQNSGGGSNTNAVVADVLRTAVAQCAVRRLLSVVRLQVFLFPSMENAIAAALNAFGGRIEVWNPFELQQRQWNRQLESDTMKDDEGEEVATATATRQWEEDGKETKDDNHNEEGLHEVVASTVPWRLRECLQVLEPPRDVALQESADLVDLDDTTLPHRAATAGGGESVSLLQSTVGPVTVSALVEMVLLSVRHMDVMNEHGVQALHLQGLERMQYNAAKKAQREEILRQRRIEQQGVEGIPVERLLLHLRESTAMYARGTQLLDGESTLAVMLRAAFFSLLDGYDAVAEEAESRVREAQALIARALALMPFSMLDTALDAVCARLRADLQRRTRDTIVSLQQPSSRTSLTSVYQLVIQVLFTLFSARAPVQEQGATAFLFLNTTSLSSAGGGGMMADAEDSTSMELQSRVAFTIDTENPVEWLQSEHDTPAGSYPSRKRLRDEDLTRTNINKEMETGMDGLSRFFREDNIDSPCIYSHFLSRVMELLTEAGLPSLLLDLLLQCPRITRYVWNYIHVRFCLSPEKVRCVLGMSLLKNLAIKRVVCRRYAVNSLLHLAAVWDEYPRRLAVRQLGALLSDVGPDGQSVIDKHAEMLLIRYAKLQMANIPITKLPSLSTTMATTSAAASTSLDGGVVVLGGQTAKREEEHDVAALREKHMRKLVDALDRYLGLFLMLCARQPKQLFPELLTVFKECVERHNVAMMHLLVNHVDVRRMCQLLFRTDALSFMSNVMPYLRRHCTDAGMFVQNVLWAISAELRQMGEAGGRKTSTSPSPTAADLGKTALALLGHARVMYDVSDIPLLYRSPAGDAADSTASLHDVRFIAPFMSLITAGDLRRTHLRSFLHFVQLQLQKQQHQQQQPPPLSQPLQKYDALSGVDSADGVAYMNGEELHQFIEHVVREILVRSPVRISDGASRGLSRIDLLVYLHRAPQGSHAADAHNPNGPSSASSTAAGRPESRGILGAVTTSSPAAAMAGGTGGVTGETATTQAAEDLPISPLTTKEVIAVLFRLTRSFDNTTTELLYGPEEIKSAVRQLMQHGNGLTVPSQLMATLILACSIHAQRPHADLVRFVQQEVLLPLAKDATWEHDAQLWRGVLLFAERYYRECSSFLVNLPDHVLIDALRATPQLCDYFREEHGNNASFGHVLGSL